MVEEQTKKKVATFGLSHERYRWIERFLCSLKGFSTVQLAVSQGIVGEGDSVRKVALCGSGRRVLVKYADAPTFLFPLRVL